MPSFNPPELPIKSSPKDRSTLKELQYQARLFHYRYEINTGLHVMSPGEKLTFNLIVLGLLWLLVMNIIYYLRATVRSSVERFCYYLTGRLRLTDQVTAIEMVVRKTIKGVATATMTEGWRPQNGTFAFAP